jgi:hypothetical protein
MIGPTGPAVEQLPAKSHTLRVPVCAIDVSVPEATLVESVKLASAAFARPEPESLAVQVMLTSVACQAVSGFPQAILGAIVSCTVIVKLPVEELRCKSAAVQFTVVPSGNADPEAGDPDGLCQHYQVIRMYPSPPEPGAN